MAGTESYDITICNWNAYQPRKDLKSLSWIRIDSDIFFSENFFLLDNNQKILFFYVLTYAGKKNTDTYSFNPEFVSANLKMGVKQLNEGIEKLESLGIVHRLVTESSRIRTDLCTTIRNDTNEHNVTNDTIRTISPEPQKAVAVVEPKINQVSINLFSKEVPISVTLVKAWADTYPKEYLELELKKARNWLITNPHKNPKKNYGRFFNGWFDRGWDKYRQTLKSNPTQITVEDLEAILKKDAE